MERRRGRSRLGLRARRREEQCGCVPQVSLVSYEDLATAGREETEKRQGWTKRLTLLWCGGGGSSENIVKRRNDIVTIIKH